MAIDPDKPHAFLSYTRSDDDYLKGGITWLREELEKSVRAHTGYPFQIFQDVEDIQPGDRWGKKLDQALEGAQIFIPILTPSFFRSDFCRREARAFLNYEAKAKRAGLILPLYLIRTPVLENAALREADDIAMALRERQHDDWRSVAVKLQHEDTRWQAAAEKMAKLAETIALTVEQDVPVPVVVDEPPLDVSPTTVMTDPEPARTEDSDAESARLAEELDAAKTKLAEVEKVREDERRYWQAKEVESQEAVEAALAEASMELGAEARKQRDLAKEKERLELALKASEEAASRLKDVEEKNARLRGADPVDAAVANAPSMGGFSMRHAAMMLAALGVGGLGSWLLTTDNDVARYQAEVQELRTQLAAEQATNDGNRQDIAAADPQGMETGGRQPFDTFRDCDDVCPEMVVLPAGEFVMGSPEDEEERRDNEGPQRKVTIAEPFALCESEVTFAQWDACVADGGCDHKPDDEGWGRDDRPVINVSWEDAQQYLRWLSETTGATYRLPSEAEWEYAARAGKTTPFSTGGTITTDQANYDGNYPYAGGAMGEFRERTAPVGSLPANPFGLFDMHGNVWEWVEDRYHQDYKGAPNDGSPWLSGATSRRVLRGGSWSFYARDLRSACRLRLAPDVRGNGIGFRCARVQE